MRFHFFRIHMLLEYYMQFLAERLRSDQGVSHSFIAKEGETVAIVLVLLNGIGLSLLKFPFGITSVKEDRHCQ